MQFKVVFHVPVNVKSLIIELELLSTYLHMQMKRDNHSVGDI